MVLIRKSCARRNNSETWPIVHEEGREIIQEWSEERLRKRGKYNSFFNFFSNPFSLDTAKSFLQNVNLMVVIQIMISAVAIYVCQLLKITYQFHVGVLVSPVVFPLAFSINTDFQRREKVLEDLAMFKSTGMVWYFCMREWRKAADLDKFWITVVRGKLKSLLFHLREYLFTSKLEHRKVILRVIYEDFSDASQLIEDVRASKLPANSAIISRVLHLLHTMSISFERLRVIREYRSPRSIRSFNKVIILILPIVLAPYFVELGVEYNNKWQAYFVSTIVAFVFSLLQGVQDQLDDPFDGLSEDDIQLDSIDEWTKGYLDHAMKRSFDINRFEGNINRSFSSQGGGGLGGRMTDQDSSCFCTSKPNYKNYKSESFSRTSDLMRDIGNITRRYSQPNTFMFGEDNFLKYNALENPERPPESENSDDSSASYTYINKGYIDSDARGETISDSNNNSGRLKSYGVEEFAEQYPYKKKEHSLDSSSTVKRLNTKSPSSKYRLNRTKSQLQRHNRPNSFVIVNDLKSTNKNKHIQRMSHRHVKNRLSLPETNIKQFTERGDYNSSINYANTKFIPLSPVPSQTGLSEKELAEDFSTIEVDNNIISGIISDEPADFIEYTRQSKDDIVTTETLSPPAEFNLGYESKFLCQENIRVQNDHSTLNI